MNTSGLPDFVKKQTGAALEQPPARVIVPDEYIEISMKADAKTRHTINLVFFGVIYLVVFIDLFTGELFNLFSFWPEQAFPLGLTFLLVMIAFWLAFNRNVLPGILIGFVPLFVVVFIFIFINGGATFTQAVPILMGRPLVCLGLYEALSIHPFISVAYSVLLGALIGRSLDQKRGKMKLWSFIMPILGILLGLGISAASIFIFKILIQ